MRPTQISVDPLQIIVRAAVVLHNFLRQTNSAGYCPGGFVDSHDSSGKLKEGEWRRIVPNVGRSGLLNDLPNVRGSRSTKTAVEFREMIKSYVNSMKGSLLWQWN